jgi:hypothetical protein
MGPCLKILSASLKFATGRSGSGPPHFQHLKRLAVASALEEVAQLGIDRGGQLAFELLDPFGDGLQAFGVTGGITPAFFVGDDGEALAQGGGQVGQDFFHR